MLLLAPVLVLIGGRGWGRTCSPGDEYSAWRMVNPIKADKGATKCLEVSGSGWVGWEGGENSGRASGELRIGECGLVGETSGMTIAVMRLRDRRDHWGQQRKLQSRVSRGTRLHRGAEKRQRQKQPQVLRRRPGAPGLRSG